MLIKATVYLGQWFSTGVILALSEDIWQYLEAFLIVTTVYIVWLLAIIVYGRRY